jgi:hypothetical protein
MKATDSPHRRQRLDENELTAASDYRTARRRIPDNLALEGLAFATEARRAVSAVS